MAVDSGLISMPLLQAGSSNLASCLERIVILPVQSLRWCIVRIPFSGVAREISSGSFDSAPIIDYDPFLLHALRSGRQGLDWFRNFATLKNATRAACRLTFRNHLP